MSIRQPCRLEPSRIGCHGFVSDAKRVIGTNYSFAVLHAPYRGRLSLIFPLARSFK